MGTIREMNARLRAELGVKITHGFEFSKIGFNCPNHGFCEEVITKFINSDMYGFGMDSVGICPQCNETCEPIKGGM